MFVGRAGRTRSVIAVVLLSMDRAYPSIIVGGNPESFKSKAESYTGGVLGLLSGSCTNDHSVFETSYC